jgi:hypothetical protein
MKLDWPHTALLIASMLFVVAILIIAAKFPNLGLGPIVGSAAGALLTLIGAAFRGAQVSGNADAFARTATMLHAQLLDARSQLARHVDTTPPKTPRNT